MTELRQVDIVFIAKTTLVFVLQLNVHYLANAFYAQFI